MSCRSHAWLRLVVLSAIHALAGCSDGEPIDPAPAESTATTASLPLSARSEPRAEGRDLDPPVTRSAVRADDVHVATRIAVSTETIAVDGTLVIKLKEGSVPGAAKRDGKRGFHITPLYERLAGASPTLPSERGHSVALVVDEQTTYRLISEVVSTAVAAGFVELFLVGRSPGDGTSRAIRVVSAPVAARAVLASRPAEPAGVPPGSGDEVTALPIEETIASDATPGVEIRPGETTTTASPDEPSGVRTTIPAGWIPGMALPSGVIRRKLRSHREELEYCYSRALKKKPALRGTMKLRFVIGPDGIVTRPRVVDKTFTNVELEKCVIYRVRKIKFPRPDSGRSVEVAYPFVFGPTRDLPTPIGIVPDASMIEALRSVPLVLVSAAGIELHSRGKPVAWIPVADGDHDFIAFVAKLVAVKEADPEVRAVGIHMEDWQTARLLYRVLDATRALCSPADPARCTELFPEPFFTVEP